MDQKNSNLSIKEALHLFHQDGALDIIAGATLLNFAFDVLNQGESTSLFTWVPILLYSSIKNKNTLPKISQYLKDVSDRQLRLWTVIPSVAFIITLVFLGIIMLGDPLNLAQVALPVTGDLKSLAGFIFLALVLLIPAFWIDLKQFFFYSGVAFLAAIITFFFLPPAWSVFAIAAVMLFFGGRMMVLFSRQYTLPEPEKTDEN